MLYAAVPGSSWSRNQSRSCANESGGAARAVALGRRSPPRPAAAPLDAELPARPRRRLKLRQAHARCRAPRARVGGLEEARSGSSTRRRRARARRPGSPGASGRRARRSRRARRRARRRGPRPRSPRAPPRPACAGRRTPVGSAAATARAPGSARRSTLPFGVSGSASSATNAAGTMYSGSLCAERGRAARRRRARPRRARPVGDEPLVAGRVLAHDDHAPRARRAAARSAGLDLAELDAEAADLDLVVDAAEELERRRRAASGAGRRCGRGAPPASRERDRGRSARPSAPAGRGSRARRRRRRCRARPARRSAPAGRRRRARRPACSRSAGRSAIGRRIGPALAATVDADGGLGGPVEVPQRSPGVLAAGASASSARQRLAAATT